MSTRSVDLASLGAGLFSATLGVAIQASGLNGTSVAIGSWIAVVAGLLMLWLGSRRVLRHHRPRPRHDDHDRHIRTLSHEAKRLGKEVVEFKRRRDSEEPRSLPSVHRWSWKWNWRTKHPRRPAVATEYLQETVSLYRREHAADVRAVVRALRSQEIITEAEASGLCDPLHPDDIEAIGLRLIELAEMLARRLS